MHSRSVYGGFLAHLQRADGVIRLHCDCGWAATNVAPKPRVLGGRQGESRSATVHALANHLQLTHPSHVAAGRARKQTMDQRVPGLETEGDWRSARGDASLSDVHASVSVQAGGSLWR